MGTDVREGLVEQGGCQDHVPGGLPVIICKRTGDESVRVEFDSANGWINLYTQKTVVISRSGSQISFGLNITLPNHLWALVICRADGIIITNNLIPGGFDGLFRADLRLIHEVISDQSLKPDTLLISIVPFARVDFDMRDDSPKNQKGFEELVKDCSKGAPFFRAKAMSELLERFPDRGRSYIQNQILEATKDPKDLGWGDFGEAFVRVVPKFFNDVKSLPLLIKVMDNFGTPIKEKVAPLLVLHNTEEVAQALIRAYITTPFWDSSFSEGREAVLDWDYENAIVQAMCRLDNPSIVDCLYTALLRGSRAREKAFQALERFVGKRTIASYFEPYLTKEHNSLELTDVAANARWVVERLKV